MAKKLLTLVIVLVNVIVVSAQPKREFRGAWIQCVNGQFQGLGTEKMQQTLTYQLDALQKDGVNAIIFQVRPECDALYQSSIEPWSRFLSGKQGQPLYTKSSQLSTDSQLSTPNSQLHIWDPLQWMITECHKRGMELHAWINPFRAKTKVTHELASNNIAVRRPDLIFEYDGLYILNPAKQENRDYICRVASDIVRRYDVDGLHFDDYFYPYPTPGCEIPDQQDFQNNPRGFSNIGDWRRDNVTLFVKELYDSIHSIKPWVKVGVSPFGIWRNQRNDPNGSATNGLQNYDDLYADIVTWVNNGYVDYCVPQLYWQIGHKAADYATLIKWWDTHCNNRPLFIGEDIERTAKYADLNNPQQNQMAAKFKLHAEMPHVEGFVLWYAKAAVDNIGNYGTSLRNYYWRYPALQPEMPFIDDTTPAKVKKVKPIWTSDGYTLFWQAPKANSWKNEASKYVVYRFSKGEDIDISNPTHIVAITYNTWYNLPYNNGKEKYTYVVTALNRLSNESAPVKKKVKL